VVNWPMFEQCSVRKWPSEEVSSLYYCCLADGADVLYNKFHVNSSSPPDNPPQHPNSDYNCVVATTGQWRVSRCDQQHHVVCQSVALSGTINYCEVSTRPEVRCTRCGWARG